MSELEKQESQKTVVAFIAGLLIGGLLVWVFGDTPNDTQVDQNMNDDQHETENNQKDDMSDTMSDDSDISNESSTPELPVGNGSVSVKNQPAGTSVSLEGATFPSDEGWVGVRDYANGQLAGLLGVVRYSKEQGLIPESIVLQRPTVSGKTYAVVFYSESGDRVFNLAEDIQIGGAMETFTAQ